MITVISGPFARTADYPAPVDLSQKGKKETADYPHWWITQKQKKIVQKKSENSNVKLWRGRFKPGIF